MTDIGFKASVRLQNVFNTEDVDLAFLTKYPTIKVLRKAASTVVTDGSGNGTRTIPHNFGFSPSYQVFLKGTASWQQSLSGVDASSYSNAYFANPPNASNWFSNMYYIHPYTDDNNFYVQVAGGPASTTINFVYYLFLDLAEEYTGAVSNGENSVGTKFSRATKNVLERKPYQYTYTSEGRSLRFNPTKSGDLSMSLPELFGSLLTDPDPEEAVYGEVTHGLGYPPFYLAYFEKASSPNYLYETNRYSLDDFDNVVEIIDSWCDATRIRFSWWRQALKNPAPLTSTTWDEDTMTIKYLIFDEDLSDT